jgi:hypothetical protein
MSRATWVARGWLVAAIPFWAITSDLVAKSLPVILSCENDRTATDKMRTLNKILFTINNI